LISVIIHYKFKHAEEQIKVKDNELRKQSEELSTKEYELKKELARTKNQREGKKEKQS
jgi:hypothetical protein